MSVRKCIGVGMVSTLGVLTQALPAAGSSANVPGWRLVWSEEFLGTSLRANTWTAENIPWPYNAELQYYAPSNATVADGLLIIKGERRTVGGRQYASARINTRGKFAQQFGRFEARMMVPAGRGYWPAFWLLPAADVWPPEIDVMEITGDQPNRVLMTQHWPQPGGVASWGGSYVGPNFAAGFHEFAVEWSPGRIDWFVDDVLRFTTTTNVPAEPMYVILNLAIGGTLPGNPDASTVFPGFLYVDWVRVYQRDLPLANPGFETVGTGGSITSWQTFGNAGASTTGANSGTRSVRIGGIGGAGPYYAGAFQDLPASPGQAWRATTVGRHFPADRLVTGASVVLKVEWYNASGTQISFAEIPAITSTSPTGTAIPATLDAIAPAGTARARVALVMVQTGTGSGNAYFDDMTFTYATPGPIAPCFADFNQDGTVSVQDLFTYLTAYFQNCAGEAGVTCNGKTVDVDASGQITVNDLFTYLTLYFSGCP